MKHLIQIFFIISFVFLSCEEKKKVDGTAMNAPDIIQKEVMATSQDCLPDSSSCTYVRIVFPVFNDSTKSELNDLIVNKLKSIGADFFREDAVQGNFEHMAQSFILDFEAFKIDFPNYQFGWYVNMNAEIIYESERVISFRVDAESFTGGAHPNSLANFFVVDVQTNKILETSDIIGDTTRFKQMIEVAFRNQKGMDQEQSFADMGYFIDDEEFLLSNNIGLTATSVIVHFNPYEIAPYSEGATTIEVPKETLGEILKVK